MNDPKAQNGVRSEPCSLSTGLAWRAVLAALVAVALGGAAASAAVLAYDEPPTATATGSEAFGVDSAIGKIEYHAGRGLRLGDTHITLGGFVTAEADALEGGEAQGGLEGASFFLFFDPLPFVHAFAELESGGIAKAETGRNGVHSSLSLAVERAYGDFAASDALNLRFGKFLTPIGRWNPVPAEPLTWTASIPLIVENVFDESTTGSMLWGSLFPTRGGALSYSLYGAFLDPLGADKRKPPADHAAGAYLEWASLGGWTAGASYFASEHRTGSWHHLGGVDGLWAATPRLELSGEAVFGEGSRQNGSLWGLYAQAVVETIDTLYAVGRYEHFDPPDGRSLNLFDVGLAWVPVPYLRLKADYRFADHAGKLASPGFQSSLSLLF